MQWRVIVLTIIVLGLIGVTSIASPTLLKARTIAAPKVSATTTSGVGLSNTPTPAVTPQPATQTPTPTEIRVLDTATPIPRATLPPVFTPTPIQPKPAALAPAPGQTSVGPASVPTIAPSATPRPTNTPQPTFTPTATRTRTPTATPTPEYDFVVVELKEIPRPEYRDSAIIRGKLIDQSGKLVPGAYFQIDSDGTPKFEAVAPQGTTSADGTVTFSVTKGRFAVRVLGGRSEYAGWMMTGTAASGPMSDWEFTFQTTQPISPGVLTSPTSTPSSTVVATADTPTSTAIPTGSTPTSTTVATTVPPTSTPVATANPPTATPVGKPPTPTSTAVVVP